MDSNLKIEIYVNSEARIPSDTNVTNLSRKSDATESTAASVSTIIQDY